MINRLPWYKTLKPDLPVTAPDKQYAEAWLGLLVARWGQTLAEMDAKDAH